MTPTVTITEGTLAETPKTETPAAPIAKTFAEAEKEYREQFDVKHGRDITKFTGAPVKKEESKVEAKVEDVKKEEPKVETPVVEKKAKGGYARTISRLNRTIGEKDATIKQMESRLTALESGKPITKVETKVEEDPEPTREAYKSDLEWFQAVRAWDKKQATKTVEDVKKTVETSASDAEAVHRWNSYVEKKDKFAETHSDYQEVVDGCDVEFNAAMCGIIIDEGINDPAFLYDIAKTPKDAKELNKLSEQSIGAIGTVADAPTSVLRYLAKNPDDIKKLNGFDTAKSAKFIGILELKITEGAKADKTAGTEVKKEEGKQAEPAKAEVKVETPPAEPAKRPKPEPPTKVNGAAPAGADNVNDPRDMSFKERERLHWQDPRNRRR